MVSMEPIVEVVFDQLMYILLRFGLGVRVARLERGQSAELRDDSGCWL